MKAVVFRLSGSFAHFRKYFTNSSSLSYSIPPRTALCGTIAAILGLERDSYYDDFSSEQLKITVIKETPSKKIFQTLNYMKSESLSDLLTSKKHTQIPFEMVVGDPRLVYRVIAATSEGKVWDRLQVLAEMMENHKAHFYPYLGAAPFVATTSLLGQCRVERDESSVAELATPVRTDAIAQNGLKFDPFARDLNLSLVREKMPVDFKPGRLPTGNQAYLFNEAPHPIKLELKPAVQMVYRIADSNSKHVREEQITFY